MSLSSSALDLRAAECQPWLFRHARAHQSCSCAERAKRLTQCPALRSRLQRPPECVQEQGNLWPGRSVASRSLRLGLGALDAGRSVGGARARGREITDVCSRLPPFASHPPPQHHSTHTHNYPTGHAVRTTELRRRREEAQVEIRKQKREESVAKRRNLVANESGADSDDDGAVDSQVCPPFVQTRPPRPRRLMESRGRMKYSSPNSSRS